MPSTTSTMPVNSSGGPLKRGLAKAGFIDKKKTAGFLTVVTAGQLIYSSFEAFKGTFYNSLLQVLGVTNAQLGMLFSLIGISIFFYVPGGWINNRFSVRSILISGLLIRFVTVLMMVLFPISFGGLQVIAFIWGVTDAIFWPAVLNGVTIFSSKDHRGLAFGLLESLRRGMEVLMNLLLVGMMALFGGLAVFKGGMLIYNLLLLPLVWVIIRKVPANGIGTNENESDVEKAKDALAGLVKVMLMPQVWLASLTAMTIYWSYVNLIYTVPYLQAVFSVSQTQASIFGIINTGAMGIVGGLVAGFFADFVFKSPTKMMPVALGLTTFALAGVLLLPTSPGALWFHIGLLLVFSFAIFLAKSIILAPLTEAQVPSDYFGSATSVGSFLAYAPVFWAFNLNGQIIDTAATPVVAYRTIFTISAVVATCGVICALLLMALNKRAQVRDATSKGEPVD